MKHFPAKGWKTFPYKINYYLYNIYIILWCTPVVNKIFLDSKNCQMYNVFLCCHPNYSKKLPYRILTSLSKHSSKFYSLTQGIIVIWRGQNNALFIRFYLLSTTNDKWYVFFHSHMKMIINNKLCEKMQFYFQLSNSFLFTQTNIITIQISQVSTMLKTN